MDRGAWWATAYKVAKGWKRLKRLSIHTQGRNLGHSKLHLPYPHLYHTPRSSTRSLLLSDKSTPPGIHSPHLPETLTFPLSSPQSRCDPRPLFTHDWGSMVSQMYAHTSAWVRSLTFAPSASRALPGRW